MERKTIFAIESSCDETAAAVVRDGREVLSNVIFSQMDLHAVYGGVVPEIASRAHIEKINQVAEKALSDAKVTLEDIDAIAVTYGPGLVGALLVGVSFAKAVSFAKDIPLVGVNHIKGHMCANFIAYPELKPPFLCLVVSGGHTNLVMVKDYTDYEIIGRTRDDAAGEAFDKVARAIGLGYPGGPEVERAATEGNPEAFDFPRARIDESPYDFSFSGLKSAVLNTINAARMKGEELNPNDIAASFQASIIDSMRERILMAIEEFGVKSFAMAGGVASNRSLRSALQQACEGAGAAFYCPPPILCTDNAAMIGSAGYFELAGGRQDGLDLNAVPGLRL
ncbi:MAG: tRNA (adenosine(37)-N6)-threonylcarbamoyltransferase complex transferase subunit TsaD [Lachnospiraceae bacterium]